MARRKSVLDFVLGAFFGKPKRKRQCPYSYQYSVSPKRRKRY